MALPVVLTPEQFELIEAACEEIEYEARSSYSGRFMYGESCLAIVSEAEFDAFKLIDKMFSIDRDEAYELIAVISGKGNRRDSMGRGEVIYWPGITVA